MQNHIFNNTVSVSFREDGYLNATSIAPHFGKLTKDYLKTQQTQEYIVALAEYLSNRTKILVDKNQLVTVKNGSSKNGGGTWLHPKLAIHFARWLDAKFAVWCDMKIEEILGTNQTPSETTTVTQREGLRQAVHFLVGKRRLNFNDAYKLVHQRFGIKHIEDLPANRLPEAVAYVHTLALDTSLHGEVLDAPPSPPPPAKPQGVYLTDSQFHALAVLTHYMADSCDYLNRLAHALEAIGSSQSGRAHSLAHESAVWLDTCRQAITAQHKHMQPGWNRQQVAQIVATYR
ncbi:KilA-N domain-containing protein [Paralysiella testudinis]|uniref:KilA-N domain-containing protein n=1 Tax=Paralysiella testudinis TaxID=2809020 RepID=A0A892ZCD1_9NEIS|nr:KilA-N domain-containing protein [Paralysiella testudinis]QRQ80671.1 KilA-N domain-containing protein [Paralysiella testudinis]